MSAPPRSLLLTTDSVGGVFSYSVELARALQGSGMRIALASMGGRLDRERRAELRGLDHVELFESDFKLEWMPEPWDDVRAAGEWLLGLEQRCAADCVHLGGYAHGALPWRSPVVITGHSCVLSWWQAVKRSPLPAEWSRYRAAVTRGLRAAQLVTAPTRSMLAALEQHYGPLAHARVIPNAVRAAAYAPRAKRPFIMTAGRLWDEAKNAAALAGVASQLAWPVAVAGDVAAPQGARAAGPLPAGVRSVGRLSRARLARWLARAAIYALPARYEPFGLSVLEAALSGCALVLGDIPSLCENWSDAALFVDPEDRAALAAALQQLIADGALRERLAERARERAQAFSPQAMASAQLAAYAAARELRQSRAAGGAACAW